MTELNNLQKTSEVVEEKLSIADLVISSEKRQSLELEAIADLNAKIDSMRTELELVREYAAQTFKMVNQLMSQMNQPKELCRICGSPDCKTPNMLGVGSSMDVPYRQYFLSNGKGF